MKRIREQEGGRGPGRLGLRRSTGLEEEAWYSGLDSEDGVGVGRKGPWEQWGAGVRRGSA